MASSAPALHRSTILASVGVTMDVARADGTVGALTEGQLNKRGRICDCLIAASANALKVATHHQFEQRIPTDRILSRSFGWKYADVRV